MAKMSLYRHAPNWFPALLALQDTGPLHTTWRYSDLIGIVYHISFIVFKIIFKLIDHISQSLCCR